MPAAFKPRRGDISRKIKRKKGSVAPLGLDKNANTIFTIIPPQKGLWTKASRGLIQNYLDANAILIGMKEAKVVPIPIGIAGIRRGGPAGEANGMN